MNHPGWCDPDACTADRQAGSHRSVTRRVGDDVAHPVASLWLAASNGCPGLLYMVPAVGPGWDTDEAEQVLLAVVDMLTELRREPS